MSNEKTQPPVRAPNTFRTWLPRIWAWCLAHPHICLPVAAFLLGGVVGYGLHK